MIGEGSQAPPFELPAWIDGVRRRVSLEEFLGRVVVLAFYPADFNPGCDDDADLDALNLLGMGKDVTVLGIGPDSVYSHAAFAREYDLSIPLLADTRRDVAAEYGVVREDDLGQSLVERAVVVIDHDGAVTYTWRTADLAEQPPIEPIKNAIADTSDDDDAFARYRVGHAHYVEGRRAFTSGMDAYQDSDWMLAQSDFVRARDEFEEAAEDFDSAVRFADDAALEAYYKRVHEKARALWQGADWLGKSANAYASGSGDEGAQLREDAERPLEHARDFADPIDPDEEWPPDEASEGDEAVDADQPDGDDDPDLADGPSLDAQVTDEVDDAEIEAIEAELADETTESEPDAGVGGPPAADPAADLSSGSGQSASLEPADDEDDEDEEDLSDPDGASDADLADIPTTDELAAQAEEREDE